jgi:lysophospholipase L1-like esterase
VQPPTLKPGTRFARGAVAAAFALIGLASGTARAQVRTPTHVACVGDSITFGYLASNGKDYPSDLQAIFGSSVKVMNFGRNSATLLSTGDTPYITVDNGSHYTAATSFVSGAGASAVVDVIIMLGTNDTKSNNWMPTAGMTRATQFMTDLSNMVDHFTNLSTHPVVYLALPRRSTPTASASARASPPTRSIRSSGRSRSRRGCRSSTFTRRPPGIRKSSRMASTRPTRATCCSRRSCTTVC